MSYLRLLLIPAATLALSFGQSSASLSGHWQGSLNAGEQGIPIIVDIAEGSKDAWQGYFSIDQQGAPQEIALERIKVSGTDVSFGVNMGLMIAFTAKLDPAAGTMAGTAPSPGGKEAKFQLKRTGPSIPLSPPVSSPIDKNLHGKWEGALEIPNAQKLRLVLQLSNGPDGKGVGKLTSLDQGGIELGVGNLKIEGNKLSFDIRQIGGEFSGTINSAQTEIPGEWRQGPAKLVLVLKKQPAAK